MLAYLKERVRERVADLDARAEMFSVPVLAALIAVTTFQKLSLILHTDGGGDLLGADIPKSMMLLAGQDPYVSNPWASPYPPFLLIVVGAIIKITTGSVDLTSQTIGQISQNVRLVGLFADGAVCVMVYAALKAQGVSGLRAIAPAALFLTLPSISLSPYYWFNSDVFGYPILAASVLAFLKNRSFLGTVLLATATIFKIHPILAVLLMIFWLARRGGLVASVPTLATTTSILSLGLVAPAFMPGYLGSILGFNLSSGFGGGTSSFTMMNLLYDVIPSLFHAAFAMSVVNQVWLALTAGLFAFALGVVWFRAREMNAIDVVSLGLLVWLIPLRQIYTHYVVWAIVPFIMRGRLRQTIVVGGLLEFANTMASWSWNLPPDPFPVLATPFGFLATSIAYLSVSVSALIFILKDWKAVSVTVSKFHEFKPPVESILPEPLKSS